MHRPLVFLKFSLVFSVSHSSTIIIGPNKTAVTLQGDVKKAVKSLRAALQWRCDFGVSDLLCAAPVSSARSSSSLPGDDRIDALTNTLRIENASGKIYVRGYDRQGRAFMYMRPARENTNRETDNMRHLVWNLEKAIACTARRSRELSKDGVSSLDKINLIIDYDGFKLINAPPLSTSKFTLDILQKHYPERMHRIYCLNPPMVFRAFWSVIKPFVDPVTKEKIVFISSKAGLKQLVDTVDETRHKLEPVAGGTHPMSDFDSHKYLNTPFNVSFDE
jgi:hypothetical protein